MANGDMVKLTGLWKNTGEGGKTYLSGRLNASSSIMIFPNTYKKGPKDPDYIAYIKPNEEKAQGSKPEPAGNDL